MLTFLAAAAIVKLAYSFPVDTKRTYDVQSTFDGFIPLFGGRQDKVEVDLVVTAKGVSPASDGTAQTVSTLDDIKVLLDGTPLAIVTIDTVKDYFPPTTISMTPFGATLKTDAPNLQLPVKLPGLDIKRFPDITYLPLQLPEDGAQVGQAYTFRRSFGDSDMVYTVTPTRIAGDKADMDVAMSQNYEVLENEGKEVVKDTKDAVARVKTALTGKGVAKFDSKLGVFTFVRIDSVAKSVVTDLATKKESNRDLKTSLVIKLRP